MLIITGELMHCRLKIVALPRRAIFFFSMNDCAVNLKQVRNQYTVWRIFITTYALEFKVFVFIVIKITKIWKNYSYGSDYS